MFVPRQLGSSKLGITVLHNVLMSNQRSYVKYFYFRQETVTYDTWCQGSSQFGTWQFDMTTHWWPLYNFDVPWQWPVQCAYLVQWCTVPRISMSIVCNQYSMSRYQLVSVHSMAWPCLGLLAALLTSMFAESFYVLSSLCFASSLELTILGWHYFGSGTVSRINDRSSYPIPLLQKNIASWAQWR